MHVVASSRAYLYVYRMKWVKMCVALAAARACFSVHSGIRCDRVGHIQRECPYRYRGPDPRRCFTCDQTGHLAKECRQGNDVGTSVSGSRRPGVTGHGLPSDSSSGGASVLRIFFSPRSFCPRTEAPTPG